MSRSYDLDVADRDPIELAADRPRRRDVADGPADGCTGAPWCECWTCARVPAGGFFAFETNAHHDDWEPF